MTIETEIHNFFAVTVSGSLYEVTDEEDENGYPIVKKIVMVGNSSSKPIGWRPKGGSYVGIARGGIVLYNEDNPKPGRVQLPEKVNTRFHHGHTSPVVALFLNKEDAMTCVSSLSPLEKGDPRWLAQTKAVIDAIGKDHNVFIPSEFDSVLQSPREQPNPLPIFSSQ